MPKSKPLRKQPKQKTNSSSQKTENASIIQRPQRTIIQTTLPTILIPYYLLGNPSLIYLLLLSVAIPNLVLLVTQTTTTISNSNVLEGLRLHLVILLRLALALRSKETRKETQKGYLKETQISTKRGLKRFLKPLIIQI